MKRKGIILAGGTGSRLYPLTVSVSKQLMPVYDKPMIYYPLSVLMLCHIREILMITTKEYQAQFQQLLGDGSQFGLSFSYVVQESPDGLPCAFTLGEAFLDGAPSALILGDNLFYGADFRLRLLRASGNKKGATVFGYRVQDPSAYGVVEFDKENKVVDIEEKPKHPRSKWALPGLYFVDSRAPEIAAGLKPSARGELEITDLLRAYMKQQALEVIQLGRGTAWLDTGSHDALISAAHYVQTIEQRQGLKIACLEEIAFLQKWIEKSDIEKAIERSGKSTYAAYLKDVLERAAE